MDWKVETGIYTLLYTKSIGNQDLLGISRKTIKYPVIAYMGIESGKEWMYVCVCVCMADSFCCTPETNKHWESPILQ